MSTSPICLADPARFMALVREEDAAERSSAFGESFVDIAVREIVRFASYPGSADIAEVRRFYRDQVMPRGEEERWTISRAVQRLYELTRTLSATAFLPAIHEDVSRRIVATSVIDFVSYAPTLVDDRLANVRTIVGLVAGGDLMNPGAAFGGLLNLGDERVCALLAAVRDRLDSAMVDEVAKSHTGIIHAATVDFYIDWLERIPKDTRLFGSVASGLMLLAKGRSLQEVLSLRRPFPIWSERAERIKPHLPPAFADYARSIAGRLQAVERAEPPPRILPLVMKEWWIATVTDPAEAAQPPPMQPPPADPARPAPASSASGSPAGARPAPAGDGTAGDAEVEKWWDGGDAGRCGNARLAGASVIGHARAAAFPADPFLPHREPELREIAPGAKPHGP
jgi:hypothetical protein